MTILSFVLALPALAIAGYMAYRNYAPVRTLVQAIAKPGDPHGSGNRERVREFGTLMDFVRTSLEQRTRDERMLPLLRGHFFRKILEGEGTVLRDAMMYAEALGIRFASSRFIVFSVEFGKGIRDGVPYRIPSPEDVQTFLDSFRRERPIPANDYHAVQRNARSCSIICNATGTDESRETEELRDLECSLIRDLAVETNCQATIGRSLPCAGLDRIQVGQQQAQAAAEQRIVKGWGVVVPYSEDLVRQRGEPFSYDIDTERAVIAAVRSGDQAQLERLLDLLYRELEKRTLTKDVAQCLLYDLISTALKCIQELKNDPLKSFSEDINLIDFLLETDSLQEACQKARQVFTMLCGRNWRTKRSHNEYLKDSLVSYLGENFTDPELGLKSVSHHFSISPGYLSRFFKEQTGENFIDYLHRLRLEHTLLLLKRRDGRKIKDISREAGFGNDIAMIRLFKKEFGESPSDFRERL
jgi:AraC-like DNA-binding protein